MTKNQTLTLIAAAILCASLTGCKTTSVSPLGGGYEEVVHTWTSISEPEATQISLQYRKPSSGRIIIWPSVQGYVLKDDLAVFLGEKATEKLDTQNRRATEGRLFAVKSPELPLDITAQVLQQYCTETGLASTNFVKDSFGSLKETKNALEIPFGILSRGERGPGTIDIHDTTMTISWHDIEAIMQDVKTTGTIHKDRVWGTSYIKKEFKPETTDK